jgi:hypothetical protein
MIRTMFRVVPAARSESRDPYAVSYREGTDYGSPLSRGRQRNEFTNPLPPGEREPT